MSRIENVKIKPQNIIIKDNQVIFKESTNLESQNLPQIYWFNNQAWDVANLYAYDLMVNERVKLKTIQTDMQHLNAYASWLETKENLTWWHFPNKKSERCVFVFKGYLIQQRNNQEIAPSTATHRMRAVSKYYRWVQHNNLINKDFELWQNKLKKITVVNKFGFEHSFNVLTTDLAIPLKANNSNIDLEDGVSPINPKHVPKILEYAKTYAPIEIYLMLKLGFFTGMRIGSITDLKVATIENYSYLEDMSMATIRIGLDATPPVHTKFSKGGNIIIPTELVNELLGYAYDVRRLKRIKKVENSENLFLTIRGNKYLDDEGKSINVAIHRLRKSALEMGVYEFKDFYFHRTRATFATVLMQYCLEKMDVTSAVQLVRDCCLHKDEKTTLKYVKFIEQNKQLAKISNEYTKAFLGL